MFQNKKLVIFDIDGTLISYKNQAYIPSPTIDAINKLKANGHIIAFASGRSLLTVEHIMNKLEINNAVLHNGAQIIINNETVYSNKIGKGISQKICQRLLNTPLCVFAFDGENIYINNASEDSIEYLINETGKKDIIKQLSDNNQSLYSINMYGEYDINFSDIKSVEYNKHLYEITAKNVNKKNGIKKLAKELNFKMNDIVAIGDGMNDIDMIKAAGIGIAVGNACDNLKAVADIVSDEIEDGGILKVFKELGLI